MVNHQVHDVVMHCSVLFPKKKNIKIGMYIHENLLFCTKYET